MDHTHEYDCIVCGAHFDSSKDLARHNEEEHLKHAKGMEVPRQPGGTAGSNNGRGASGPLRSEPDVGNV